MLVLAVGNVSWQCRHICSVIALGQNSSATNVNGFAHELHTRTDSTNLVRISTVGRLHCASERQCVHHLSKNVQQHTHERGIDIVTSNQEFGFRRRYQDNTPATLTVILVLCSKIQRSLTMIFPFHPTPPERVLIQALRFSPLR